MKKWFYSSLIVSSLFFTSCATLNQTEQASINEQEKTNLSVREYSVQSVMWQQNAAEYTALCHQAFNLAKIKLDHFIEENKDSKEKLAIITDIDETVLDNSPYNARLILDDVDYIPETWKEWTDLAAAEAVPGAYEFLKYAHSRGVEIFYVTNRLENEKEATIKNIISVGFPYKSENNLLLMGETSDKEPRFEKVRSEHNVILYIGDNLADFTSKFRVPNSEERKKVVELFKEEFGHLFIVLPNPMYGDWEIRGIYQGKTHDSEEKKNEIRKSSLRAY